jgi:hypothetical protein
MMNHYDAIMPALFRKMNCGNCSSCRSTNMPAHCVDAISLTTFPNTITGRIEDFS